jgi:protein-L-isoaspartate(D-aspartate) O-methyltransferase
MTPTPDQVALHMGQFLDMLDAAFRCYGVPDGLPDRFRKVVMATPRHNFVHRFRLRTGPLSERDDERSLRNFDADPLPELAHIYSDAVLTHVDAAGQPLPSTNSQPSYVLWLLRLLDLQPGQRVLEIGSGSGWLAAVMGRLVGDDGYVTGLEIIPELAEQSRADLARLDIDNVSVVTADGAQGHAAAAPFDRVIITAATWDLPFVLFDQVTVGGRVLVPVELRGGGCQVTVLRREGTGFVAMQSVGGWFVPLVGPGQRREGGHVEVTELPFWDEIGWQPSRRIPLPLATGTEAPGGSAVNAFRAFLGRTTPGFATFKHPEPAEQKAGRSAESFGVVDRAGRSVALWRGGELVAYGGESPMQTLAQAYTNWTAYGMPGLAGFALRVVPAGSSRVGNGRVWMETRGETVLIWSPLPGAEDWKALLCDPS